MRHGSEWMILGVILGILLVMSTTVALKGVDVSRLKAAERPHAERNEWGQVIRPLSYQCVATILRWSKNCGYEWIDSQQERDDAEEK